MGGGEIHRRAFIEATKWLKGRSNYYPGVGGKDHTPDEYIEVESVVLDEQLDPALFVAPGQGE